ncbi:MAG TPA: hypothetical protein VJ570_14865 [Holophagaceae bacterium]|nr:hypothetical protein [Holophagaceae bacterium]
MQAGSIQTRLLGVLAIGISCSVIACSGGGGGSASGAPATAAVEVQVAPSSPNVAIGSQLPVSATISGIDSAELIWMVDGVEGGSAAVGTIVGTGESVTYMAPETSGTHLVQASLRSNPSKKGAATVWVTAPVSVTVNPATATVSLSGALTFTASVSETPNTSVTWTVDGIPGGNSSAGTISGSGATATYTAPAAPGSHTLVATSVADSTKSASAVVSIQAGVQIALSPGAASLASGTSLTLTATVSGTDNTSVLWSVDGISNGNATVGSIAGSGATGTYTAPSAGGTHLVKATSGADPTKFSTATLTVNSTVALGPPAAFPGCEGMGCGATGGRGGVVYTVNTLEDSTNAGAVPWNGPSGPTCSLRDAMTKSGARTIVFSVGGTITLKSAMYPVPPDLTIAGQTAPGGGIQITGDPSMPGGGSLMWLSGNTILRYLRIRPGKTQINTNNQGLAGLGVSLPGANDVVIDHCSFEWDGNKSATWWSDDGVQRSTFSWNLDAESCAQSTGLLIGGYNMGQANLDQSSWDGHHNVLATIDHRLPYTNLKYGRWINNYAFGYHYAALVRGGTQFDFIGNVWDGMSSGLKADTARAEVRWADTVAHNEGSIVPGGTARIYMSNNFGPRNPNGTLDNFSTMLRTASSENGQLDDTPVSSAYKAPGPTIPSSLNGWPITITALASPADLRALLLPKVGAYQRLASDGSWVPNRDALDARIIGYIQNPASSPTALVATAGTLPNLAAGTPAVSTVGDGIPDAWKTAHGLSTSDRALAGSIRPNARGFTVLELYLSGLFPNGTALP